MYELRMLLITKIIQYNMTHTLFILFLTHFLIVFTRKKTVKKVVFYELLVE